MHGEWGPALKGTAATVGVITEHNALMREKERKKRGRKIEREWEAGGGGKAKANKENARSKTVFWIFFKHPRWASFHICCFAMSDLIRNILFWLCFSFFIIKMYLIYTKAVSLCISGGDFSVTGYIVISVGCDKWLCLWVSHWINHSNDLFKHWFIQKVNNSLWVIHWIVHSNGSFKTLVTSKTIKCCLCRQEVHSKKNL